MKSSIFLQGLFFIAGVAAQTPRQRYKAICDDLDGQSKTFDNGYEITYFCTKNGIIASMLDTQTTDSPDECAQACNAYSGCKGSSWLYTSKECQIFGEGGAGEEVRATVFMRRDSPEVDTSGGGGQESSDCTATEHALHDCEESERELTEELEACRAGKRECEEENEECEDKLAHERVSCRLAERKALPKCPAIHDTVISSGGKNYKAWCNHQHPGTFYKQTDLGFDACIAQCSTEARCKGIRYFVAAGARCKFYETSDASMGPVSTTMLVSLHKL